MNFNKMLKQAQKMQSDASKMQADLAAKTFTASVGGGKVTVTATGAGDVVSIKISKDVVDPEDVEMLEDLVLSGVRQAIEEGKKRRKPRWASSPPGWAGWACRAWGSRRFARPSGRPRAKGFLSGDFPPPVWYVLTAEIAAKRHIS